jgi:hypothetical protein
MEKCLVDCQLPRVKERRSPESLRKYVRSIATFIKVTIAVNNSCVDIPICYAVS